MLGFMSEYFFEDYEFKYVDYDLFWPVLSIRPKKINYTRKKEKRTRLNKRWWAK